MKIIFIGRVTNRTFIAGGRIPVPRKVSGRGTRSEYASSGGGSGEFGL
jgi:hypothetical protein